MEAIKVRKKKRIDCVAYNQHLNGGKSGQLLRLELEVLDMSKILNDVWVRPRVLKSLV